MADDNDDNRLVAADYRHDNQVSSLGQVTAVAASVGKFRSDIKSKIFIQNRSRIDYH